MKKFHYNFHGDVEVVLREDDTLLDVTQRGSNFTLRTAGDTITLEHLGQIRQYPHTLKGLYDAYQQIGLFSLDYRELPHGERLVVTDGEATKEIFLEGHEQLISTLLMKGNRVVSTSIGPNTWNCYGAIGNSCDSRFGSDRDVRNIMPIYGHYLEHVFGDKLLVSMH